MKAKRRRHDPQFKARVALEALKGIKTTQEIAKEYEVHPAQVADWKKTMHEGVAGVFERGGAGEENFEQERKRLQKLRRKMGLETIWCQPRNTSAADKTHRKYPTCCAIWR